MAGRDRGREGGDSGECGEVGGGGGGEEKERRTNPEIKNEIIFDVSTLSTLLQTLSLTHYLPPSYSPTSCIHATHNTPSHTMCVARLHALYVPPSGMGTSIDDSRIFIFV